jgi:hypothetical protein
MNLLPLHLMGGAVAMASGLAALYAVKGATVHRRTDDLCLRDALDVAQRGPDASRRTVWQLVAKYLFDLVDGMPDDCHVHRADYARRDRSSRDVVDFIAAIGTGRAIRLR